MWKKVQDETEVKNNWYQWIKYPKYQIIHTDEKNDFTKYHKFLDPASRLKRQGNCKTKNFLSLVIKKKKYEGFVIIGLKSCILQTYAG